LKMISDSIFRSGVQILGNNAGAETREMRQRFPVDSPATCVRPVWA
jgi:hypothetical protein